MRTNEKFNVTLYSAIKSNFAIERPWLGCNSDIEESVDAAKAVYFGLIRDVNGTKALLDESLRLGVEPTTVHNFLVLYEKLQGFRQHIQKGSTEGWSNRYQIKVQLIKNYFKYVGVQFNNVARD